MSFQEPGEGTTYGKMELGSNRPIAVGDKFEILNNMEYTHGNGWIVTNNNVNIGMEGNQVLRIERIDDIETNVSNNIKLYNDKGEVCWFNDELLKNTKLFKRL